MQSFNAFLAVLAFLLLALSLPIVTLSSCIALIIRVVSQREGFTRWVENQHWAFHYTYSIFILQYFTRTKLILHGDAEEFLNENHNKNIIYMLNHQSLLDWMIAAVTCVDNGLVQYFQILIKHTMRYWPFYGLSAYVRRAIFINRTNFDEDEMKRKLLSYKQHKQVSFIITPEGRRFNPLHKQILESSKQYAQDHDIQPLQHVLMPRYKGVWQILTTFDFEFGAIYDATIFFGNTLDSSNKRIPFPTMWQYMTNETNCHHIHIQKYPIETIPKKEEEFKKWLYQLYLQKDKIMEEFIQGKSGKPTKFLEVDKEPRMIPFRYFLPSVISYTFLQWILLTHPVGRQFYLGLTVFSFVLPVCVWIYDTITRAHSKIRKR